MGGLYSMCQQCHYEDHSSQTNSISDVNSTEASRKPPEIKSVTERPSIAQKLIKNVVIPDVLNKACSGMATVKYGDKIINADPSELTPTETKALPTVQWLGNSKLYAVFLTDPDALARDNPIFREFVHFAALNVEATVINSDSCGDVALEYAGPAPPHSSGLHRYVWLVYSQTVKMETEPLSEYLEGRGGKKVHTWARENGLQLVAANVFEAQWDEHCDAAHKALNFLPPAKYQSPKQKEEQGNIQRQDEKFDLMEGVTMSAASIPPAGEAEKEKELADLPDLETEKEKLLTQKVNNEAEAAEKEELKELADKDLVNDGSKAAMGEMLEEKLQTQAVNNKMEADEAAELKELADKDLVNENTKAVMGEMLEEKLKTQSVDNKMEADEAAELKELADKDLVNENTKAAMGDMLEEKLQTQAVDSKTEAKKVAELKDLEEKDLVNEDTKAAMGDMLAEKIQVQAVQSKMESEKNQELDDLAVKDLVNEDTKAAMAENLADVKAPGKDASADPVAATEEDVKADAAT